MSSKKVLPKGRRYTEQQKEQAVRLVWLAREEGRGFAAVQRITDQLGYGVESVRQWVKQADIDAGAKPAPTKGQSGVPAMTSWELLEGKLSASS
jgi:transposase